MSDPPLFIVFGGTGDLMARKLLPALYRLGQQRRLGPRFTVLAVARSTDVDDAAYRRWAREALAAAGLDPDAAAAWCADRLYYHALGDQTAGDFARLRSRIEHLEAAHALAGNRVFYLAITPHAFSATIEHLGEAGLSAAPGWVRLVVEKPFGRDLASAQALNALLHRYFDEAQVYRIDHYLGKEAVQNLLVFRFANALFESVWNRDRIDRVEITTAETLGVEGRAAFYEETGALRDIVQNHLTQLLALTAMEVPVAFAADAIRDEKVKVLRAIEPIAPEAAVYGQYAAGTLGGEPVPAYRDEAGVDPASTTETYVALRLFVNNWRWQGVPFVLRTGKRLAERHTQVVVYFRRPPVHLFRDHDRCHVQRNRLVLRLQPDEGFDLHFEVKQPGQALELATERLHFRYSEAFGTLPDGYETLLGDVLAGDQTLFVRADEVEAAWRLYAPLVASPPAPQPYAAGSWGPAAAEALS